MPRKSKVGNNSLKKINSMFDLDFEVLLIIVLIVAAILLICFLNRKHKRIETFYQASCSKNEGILNSKPQIHIFYADWCGHSKSFLENEKVKLAESTKGKCDIQNRILLIDVDKKTAKTLSGHSVLTTNKLSNHIKEAGVSKLPSFYTYKKDSSGSFKYKEFNSDGSKPSNDDIIKWLNTNSV